MDSEVKQQPHQMTALERLKLHQAKFKQDWNGILTEYGGRPGTSNLCNKNRSFDPSPLEGEELERAYLLYNILAILKAVEDLQGSLTYSTLVKQKPNVANFYGKSR